MEQEALRSLIAQAKAGDRTAQEGLVLEVQDRVYYHCKKILRNEQDAQDATQEILIAMLTGLDKLREPTAFRSWVGGITVNHCRHVLARDPRRVRELQPLEDEEGNSVLEQFEDTDDQVVPDKALDNDETRRLIMEVIDNLPAAQKMCVLFYYYDEMSVKEIAQATQVSEGTVKSRLNYARKSIKEGVEKLAGQGTKLYGLSPLPFLAYFLRSAAETEGLGAAAGQALAASVLAASESSAAGGTAAGVGAAAAGAAASGAAVTEGAAAVGTAVGVATKAAGGALLGKLALGLVGVVAVGAVTGGAVVAVRHINSTSVPAATPQTVVEETPLNADSVDDSSVPTEATPIPAPTPRYPAASAMVDVLESDPDLFYARLLDMDRDGTEELLTGKYVSSTYGSVLHFTAYRWNGRGLDAISFDNAIYALTDVAGVYKSRSTGEIFVGYGGFTDATIWNYMGLDHFMRSVEEPIWETIDNGGPAEYECFIVASTPISQLQGHMDSVRPTRVSNAVCEAMRDDLEAIDEFGGYNSPDLSTATLADTKSTLETRVQAQRPDRAGASGAEAAAPSSAPSAERLGEIFSGISFYGDLNACRITAPQAQALIGKLRELEEKEAANRQSAYSTYSYAALFDPGNGTPALFFVRGDIPTEALQAGAQAPTDSSGPFSKVGILGVWQFRNGRLVEFPLPEPRQGYEGIFLQLYETGLCAWIRTLSSPYNEVKTMYAFTENGLSDTATSLSDGMDENGTLSLDVMNFEENIRRIDGLPATDSQVRAWNNKWIKGKPKFYMESNSFGDKISFYGVSPAEDVVAALERYLDTAG